MRRPFLLVAVLLLFSAMVATAAAAAAAGQPVDRVIRDGRISESSGLAASILNPGVLWTHNDSGNPPVIYAIGTDGRTRAAVTLTGEYNRDWEAITSFRYPPRTGRAMIAIGDIGDNSEHHPSIRIAILPEPSLRTQKVKPARVFRLTYPDGPRDAEALLADPRNGRLYVVSKALFVSQIYAVPESVWPGRATGFTEGQKLVPVASTGADLITDGTFLPSGQMLLRSYGSLFLMPRPEQVSDGRLSPLATVGLPDQEQGESLTTQDGGQVVLIGSEGDRQPVLRLTPADLGDVGAALTAGKSRGATGSASATGSSGAGGDGSSAGGSGAAASAGSGTGPSPDGAAQPFLSGATRWLAGGAAAVGAGVLLVLGMSTFLRRR